MVRHLNQQSCKELVAGSGTRYSLVKKVRKSEEEFETRRERQIKLWYVISCHHVIK